MAQPGYAAPIYIGIDADQDDPTRYTAAAGQARLGLPTRDYYLLEGRQVRFDPHGLPQLYRRSRQARRPVRSRRPRRPNHRARNRLAKDQWTPERRRDPVKTHNPMTRAQLMKLAPQFNWTETLRSIGLGSAKTVDVAEPSAVAAAGKRIADVPLGTWKEYLAFRFISDHANDLPKAFDDAHFDFYGQTLNDVPEQRARWKRGMRCSTTASARRSASSTSPNTGPSDRAAGAGARRRHARALMARRSRNAAWMDAATRKAALEKLAAFDPRIGHPVKWIDYSTLEVEPRRPARQCDAQPRNSSGSCSSSAFRIRSTAPCGT